MNKLSTVITMLSITTLFLLGCSGGGNSPVTPGTQAQIGPSSPESDHGTHQLWGLWDCYMEPGGDTIEVVPLRSATFTANVNSLLEGTPGNLNILDLDLSQMVPDGLVSCTVQLRHPLPGMDQFHGFDVWGVFMHNGQSTLDYDGLTYSDSPDEGAVLLNADGYTRWFNYSEFNGSTMPIFEFTPGALSSLPDPNADLNGHRIFADGLGIEEDYYEWITTTGNADDRGIFSAGAVNSRRYEMQFPVIGGVPEVEFQYAVVAGWEPGDPTLTGSSSAWDPFDFPANANCEEAFFVHADPTESTLFNDGTSSGGSLKAEIEVFDWQGGIVSGNGVPNEIEQIVLEADFLPGGTYTYDATQLAAIANPGTDNSSVFQVDISGCTPTEAGWTDFWVIIESAGMYGGSYDQGFGTKYPAGAIRAAFLNENVEVSNEMQTGIVITSPNGGESWDICTNNDITWVTNGYTGQIKLEYSKDGFNSDINEIVDATDDDGIYDWLVPNDPSDTVRVRGTFVNDPFLHDDSNADFTIPAISYSVQLGSSRYFDSALPDFGPSIITKPNGDVYLSYLKVYAGTSHTSDYGYSTNSGASFIEPSYGTWGGGGALTTTMGIDAVGDAYHKVNRPFASLIVRFSSVWPNSGVYLYYSQHGIALVFTHDGYPVEFGDGSGGIRYKKGLDPNTPYSNGWTGWFNTPEYTAVPYPARLSETRNILKDPDDAIYFVYYSATSSHAWIRLAYNSDGEGLTWNYDNDIYDGASDGYDRARDPSIRLEEDGDWHCAFFLHTNTPSSTESIAYVRSEDGVTWSSPSTVYEVSGVNILDWVTVSAVNVECSEILVITFQENDKVYLTYSWDQGETWETPTQMSTGNDRLPDTCVTDDAFVHTCWEHNEGADRRIEYIRAEFIQD